MRATFEKAVTMFNMMGSPDLFITFTGNPEWVKQYCRNGQSWADNPDLAVRVSFRSPPQIFQVFNLKLKKLFDLLFTKQIFGKV